MKKSSSTWGCNEGGFTLLEILIAIFLLAFITILVVDTTQNAFNTMERTGEFNENNLRIETTFARFEWDITQIYSPLYHSTQMDVRRNLGLIDPNSLGNQGANGAESSENEGQQPPPPVNPALQAYYQQMLSRFERNERFITVSQEGLPIPRIYAPEKSTLEFFTSSNRRKRENIPQSHYGWVQYGLVDQDVNSENKVNPEMPTTVKSLVRCFDAVDPYAPERSINLKQGSDAAKVKCGTLLQNVDSLEFQFWDYKRRKWETNLRTVTDGEKLLRGVKILITWWDSTGKRSAERVFRPHWPAVAPQDPVANQNRNQNNGNNGSTASDASSGQPGEDEE